LQFATLGSSDAGAHDRTRLVTLLAGHRVKTRVDDHGVKPGPTGTHEYHVLLRNVTDLDASNDPQYGKQ